MDIHLSSFLLQLLIILFIAIFTILARKRPFFTFRLFPIILPFYLIKLYLRPQIIWDSLRAGDLFKILNSFFYPQFQERPVILPDLKEMSSLTIPTNLLEILVAVFLVINWKFIFRGIKILKKTIFGKYLLVTGYSLLVTSILSTLFALNVRVSLGATKSLFIIPFLLFLSALPFLSREKLREKFLHSIALSGVVIVVMNLPFLLLNILTYDHRLAGIFLSPNHLGMAIAPGILAIVVLLLSKRNVASEAKMHDNGKFKNQNEKLWCRPWRPLIDCREATPKFLFLIFAFLILFATASYGTWISLIGALFFLLFLSRINVAQDKYNPQPLCHLWQRPINEGGQSPHQNSKFKIQNSKLWSRLQRLLIKCRGATPKFLFLIFAFLIVILLLSQLSNPKLQHIINGDYYSSFHSRLMIWQSAIEISKDHWLLGVGPGNFQQAYLDYATKFNEPYIEWSAPMPHNIFLAFSTQLGVLGLLCFVLIVCLSLSEVNGKCKYQNGKLWCRLRRPLFDCREATPKFSIFHFPFSIFSLDLLSLWAFAYLVYLLLHGSLDTPYFKNDLAIIFWLVMAGIWGYTNSKPRSQNAKPQIKS